MSYDIDDLAFEMPCRFCGAEAWQWCRTKSGRRSALLHGARTSPLYSAYGQGYSEGQKHEREIQQRRAPRGAS